MTEIPNTPVRFIDPSDYESGEEDSSYVRDYEEATRDRFEQEADDWREMEEADRVSADKDNREFEAEHRRLHGPECKLSWACYDDAGQIVPPGNKTLCPKCGGMVDPVGHFDRCPKRRTAYSVEEARRLLRERERVVSDLQVVKQLGRALKSKAFEVEHHRLHGPGCVLSPTCLDGDGGVVPPGVKVLCSRCDLMVEPVGHASRCRVQPPPGLAEQLRRMAWLGGAQHAMDVRTWLLAVGTPARELDPKEQSYLDRPHRAEFFGAYLAPDVPASGTSEHAQATAFWANYYGTFRAKYLGEKFPNNTTFEFPMYLSAFIKDFPFKISP